MAMPPTYKPSPLSFGSPRTSPFRRPESPAPISITSRATTPSPSPTKIQNTLLTPSNPTNATTPTSNDGSWTPRALTPSMTTLDRPASPLRASTFSVHDVTRMARGPPTSDALSRLPASQVREMREAFQVLDRDNDGQVTREDAVDMLTNLGQDSSTLATSALFPPGQPQTLSLPTFLSTLSNLLAPLSSQQELLNAFAAFDDDDSGQVDVGELRDALLHTSPEAGERAMTEREVDQVMSGFTGRRAFAKGVGVRGEVFRYQEFVGSVMGGGEGKAEVEKVLV